MIESSKELLRVAEELEQWTARGRKEEIELPLRQMSEAAKEVGRAWSGSWLGYQANVYYKRFQPTPPGAHFTESWRRRRSEDWVEFDPEYVEKVILERAGMPDMGPVQAFNLEASDEFQMHKSTLYSILEVELAISDSPLLLQVKEQADKLLTQTGEDFIDRWMPKRTVSTDRLALNQGWRTPPHFTVLSRVESIQHTSYIVMRLEKLVRQTEAHISRLRRQRRADGARGTKVFIGHGHSPIWRELKDFIEDRLGLLVDEFDGVPTAGVSITDRLSKMLDDAAFAFLILTGEDKQLDGQPRARMNVIHEVGLFQGRLGFQRAIILLENGCEKFSNIDGLVYIPFPKDHISSAFEKIREVLERESVLSNSA